MLGNGQVNSESLAFESECKSVGKWNKTRTHVNDYKSIGMYSHLAQEKGKESQIILSPKSKLNQPHNIKVETKPAHIHILVPLENHGVPFHIAI